MERTNAQKNPKLKKKRKRGGCRDGLVVEMKRQGEDGRRGMWRGGTFFWGCVLDMRQPLHEHGARGLFDVEIGQFESVSFNFSQLTEPPWGPHISLIGYKLVFLSSHSLGLNPPFSPSLFCITQTPMYFFIHIFSNIFFSRHPLTHWTELQSHPWCLSVSHQHKTSLTLPLRHLLYSERRALSAARLVFKTNKQNNGTTDLSSQFRRCGFFCCGDLCLLRFCR